MHGGLDDKIFPTSTQSDALSDDKISTTSKEDPDWWSHFSVFTLLFGQLFDHNQLFDHKELLRLAALHETNLANDRLKHFLSK